LGGGGDDTLVGTETAEVVDSFDGGAGQDEVSFQGARRGVTVTLGEHGSGEADAFTGVEDVTGGLGDDRIMGDEGPNTLNGSAGRDEVSGGAGHDTIYGDGDIGPGGDLLSCGTGLDTILWVRPADVLARDCEQVDLNLSVFGKTTMRAHPVVRHGDRARFAIPCRSRRGCRGSVRLRRATARRGGTLRRFQTRRRGQITVAVPLPRRGALMRVSVALERRGDNERGRAVYTVFNPRQK
jgi:Ca2+-binding RTX toxin-like protein